MMKNWLKQLIVVYEIVCVPKFEVHDTVGIVIVRFGIDISINVIINRLTISNANPLLIIE